jgi:2-isopropylmalate synthase
MIQAVKEHCRRNIKQTVCESHELNEQSDPVTIVYMGISEKEGTAAWGAGIDKEPMTADLKAFISALNRLETKTAI